MELKKFAEAVEKEETLAILGCVMRDNYEDCEVVVVHNPSGMKTMLTMEGMQSEDWETLCDVMTRKRSVKVMQHYSRIVGYYSNLRNWNPSKIAELRDRQKGDYALPE